MAKKVKKEEKKVVDQDLIAFLKSATINDGKAFVPLEHLEKVRPLIEAGLAEQNPGDTNLAGEVAVWLTEAGLNYGAPPVQPAAQKEQSNMTGFKIRSEVIEVPVAKRGATKTEKYPFSQLEVGQWIGVEPTEKHPEPWKSLQSTVSGAQRRYAEQNGTRIRKSKKEGSKEVPNMVPTREFRLFQIADPDTGKPIAAIKRVA